MSDGEDNTYAPVTLERWEHIRGPFFHGTKAVLAVGDELVPGCGSSFHQGRVSNIVYFGDSSSPPFGSRARDGSRRKRQARACLCRGAHRPVRGRPESDQEEVPRNPTRSYRSRQPLHVVSEVADWQGHAPEVLNKMVASLALLREQGRDLVEDSRGAHRPVMASPIHNAARPATVRRSHFVRTSP